MENKTTEAIPDLATDAVLVKSQEMPKNSEVCKGEQVTIFFFLVSNFYNFNLYYFHLLQRL